MARLFLSYSLKLWNSLHKIECCALPDRPALDSVVEIVEQLDAGERATEGCLEDLQKDTT